MQIRSHHTARTVKRTLEHAALNDEISVCRWECLEQTEPAQPFEVTNSQEFYAFSSEVEKVLKAGLDTFSGSGCPVPHIPCMVMVLTKDFVEKAAAFTFSQVYYYSPAEKNPSRPRTLQPLDELGGEFHRLDALNKKPFSWLTGLKPEEFVALGLYVIDYGSHQVLGLNTQARAVEPRGKNSVLGPSGPAVIPGSLLLALTPMSNALHFEYISGRMDNERYDLKKVAEHLFSNPRVDLAKNHDSPSEAIEPIPYYNSSANRNKFIDFQLSFAQDDFERLAKLAFGAIRFDLKDGEFKASKTKYRTRDRLFEAIEKDDFLGIKAFRKPERDSDDENSQESDE